MEVCNNNVWKVNISEPWLCSIIDFAIMHNREIEFPRKRKSDWLSCPFILFIIEKAVIALNPVNSIKMFSSLPPKVDMQSKQHDLKCTIIIPLNI